MKLSCNLWTDEELLSEDLKYKNKKLFREGNPRLYIAAYARNILNQKRSTRDPVDWDQVAPDLSLLKIFFHGLSKPLCAQGAA
jgi:hypothetical protein